MSKVDIIRQKYPKIQQGTFNQLVNADKTSTKKYLDRMCHYWTTKGATRLYSAVLIRTIDDFDSLLPYIKNKDIYDRFYDRFDVLSSIVEQARIIKLEKEFTREGNVDVIYETDKYLVVKPLTFKASMKYGGNTKWCTAGRNYEKTFDNYVEKNHLIYILDKIETNNKINKIALLQEKSDGIESLCYNVMQFWNTADSSVHPTWFVKSGWNEDDLALIISHIRLYCYKQDRLDKVKFDVKNTMDSMKSVNLTDLMSKITLLKNNEAITTPEIENHKQVIDDFISKITKISETIN